MTVNPVQNGVLISREAFPEPAADGHHAQGGPGGAVGLDRRRTAGGDPAGGGVMTGTGDGAAAMAARWLVDNQLIGVVLIGHDGIVTDRCGGLVGWVQTGRRISDCLPDLSSHEAELTAVSCGQRQSLFLPEVRHRHATDSEERSYSLHCFPMPDKRGVALVFQDATTVGVLERDVRRQRSDLATAERRLTHARDLAKAADQAKSVFLANVSHELRTPLNVIIGNAEILRDWDPASLPAEDLHIFAEDILENGTYLLDHINDLLDLAKAEAGGIDLIEEEVGIDHMLESTVAVVRNQPSAGALTIRHHSTAGLPQLIGDGRRLRQVLLNLLGNAVKFTADGGTISARAWVDHEGAVTIEISDDGIGIAADSLDRVLLPFGQAGRPVDNRARTGNGLGLPLAKTLVELHDGTLALDSAPGEGTRVTLRFPPGRTQARR